VPVDLHSHLGEYPQHIAERFAAEARMGWGSDLRLCRTPDEHYEVTRRVDGVVALGFCAPASGLVVPNDRAGSSARSSNRATGSSGATPSRAALSRRTGRRKSSHRSGVMGAPDPATAERGQRPFAAYFQGLARLIEELVAKPLEGS
jgi:hypothetical protein